MTPFLAQVETSGITGGQFASGVCAVVGVLLLPFVRDWMKDRREREKEKRDSEKEERTDKQSLAFQERIASSNERMEKSVTALATEMAIQRELNNERHVNNLNAMKNICKSECRNFKPTA